MGKFADYDFIESVIEYTDDPLKIGRIRASIPGVIHHSSTTEKEALPWIRPFKMYCYQTFTKPMPGQKVWIIMSKTNYNEYWWAPFFETIDIVQGYLNDYYDETPDVFHAREDFVSPVMSTWDNTQGYRETIGEDFIDFYPDRTYHLNIHDCDIWVTKENKLCCGGDESITKSSFSGKCTGAATNAHPKASMLSAQHENGYEPAVMGYKCRQLRDAVANRIMTKLAAAATADKCPMMAAEFSGAADPMNALPFLFVDEARYNGDKEIGILCEKCYVN